MNIIEIIQDRLTYPVLQKVDPNTHEIKNVKGMSKEQKLAQAAIPSILIFLYKYLLTDEGSAVVIANGFRKSKLDTILEDKKTEAVEKVAHFAGTAISDTQSEMDEIAAEAIMVVKEIQGEEITADHLRSYLSSQRHVILSYLPAELQIGTLLEDDAIDDRTNKMEGPFSNAMHAIENLFSGSGSKEVVK